MPPRVISSEGPRGSADQGLLQQLTSSAGSGFFTEAQAEHAISSLHPDWDARPLMPPRATCRWAGSARRA